MKNRILATILICILVFTQFSVVLADEPNYAPDEMTNLSINEPTTASSEASEHNSADKANDGVNDNESYTYWKSAEGDTTPWWQVDMALAFAVSKIELEARKGDVDAEERSNIRIIGAQKEDFSDSTVLYEGAEDFGEVLTVDVVPAKKLRYVKVEKTAEGALSIGEFKVWVKKADILQGAQSNNPNLVPQSTVISQVVEGTATDCIGTEFEEAVNLLAAFGIMNGYPDGTFRPDATITRAEFAKVASKLLAYQSLPDAPTFGDVPQTHWAYEFVETAAASNVVNGTAEGVFSPDETITMQQTAKMLVSILGYREVAELEGGYPNGYMLMANKIKLFEDVQVTGNNITRGQIALLVANALDIEILTPNTYGDKVSASTYDGETLLYKNLDIVKAEGVVTAVKGTSLTNPSIENEENYIEINNVAFKCDFENTSDLLGMKVDYYYYDAKNPPYELVVIVERDYNKVLEINSQDLVDVTASYVEYFDGDKDRTFKLSSDMDVIFNGYALRAYDYQDLKIADGNIKLIDNDSDNYADVVIVNSVVTSIVSRVNADKMIISMKGNASPLEFNEKDDIISIISADTGKMLDISDISEDDVLTIAESINTQGAKRYVIYVSGKKIEGVFTSKSEHTIVIDSTEYDMAPSFNVDDMTLGCEGTFYVDMYGRVAYYDGTSSDGQYGILTAAGYTVGFDGAMQFKIFNDTGSFEVYEGHETKLKLDGTHYTNNDNYIDNLKNTGMLAGSVIQPVRYKVNGDNKITYIDTVTVGVGEGADSLTNSYATQDYYYKNTGVMTSMTGDSQFVLSDDTILFKLPKADEDLSSESEYEIYSTASLQSDVSYKVSAYDASESKFVKLLIVRSGSSGTAGGNSLFVVDKVMPALDEKGNDTVNVYGVYGGKETVLSAHETCKQDLTQLKQGDVITVDVTFGQQIKSYTKRFYTGAIPEGAEAISPTAPTRGGINDTLCLAYGYVNTYEDGIITIRCIKQTENQNYVYQDYVVSLNSSELKTYIYDSENEKVSVADPSCIIDAQSTDIASASKVMVRFYCRTEHDLVIFD